MIKVGINGFGRIGRFVFRAAMKRNDIQIVGINDLCPVDYLAYMLKYDTMHGQFDGTIEADVENSKLIVNGQAIRITAERNPADLKWNEVEAEYVVESTGLLNDETDEEIELVEISDAEGNRAEMRRLATVEYSGKLYHILGAVQEDETDDFSDDGLVLVRQDCTPDGADEYVITEDEREIEQVVGRYVIESLLDEIGEVSEGEETWPCGENHRPGEFCYCGQNEYLQ